MFSKLDLNKGYHQLKLAPASRYITTFSTHVGLRRYKRLRFGVSSAGGVLQEAIKQVIHDIPGTLNISDDIIIFGSTKAQHDAAVTKVLQRLQDRGLTLNKAKCVFQKPHLKVLGNIFSADGMSPDSQKVEGMKTADPPANISELRSLLGLASCCSCHIADFATITQPLRDLTRKSTPWIWSSKQDEALETLKKWLSSNALLSYFDPILTTESIVDASPVGLAAVLVQKTPNDEHSAHIFAYASRALTGVERRYSQTEREALAIVWACEHFHLYVYGHPFLT